MGFLPFLFISLLALSFSIWFWQWGVSQPDVKSITEVPGIFGLTNIIGSVLFFGSAWAVLYKSFTSKSIAFLVLGVLIVWYLVVLLLGMAGFFAWRPFFVPNIAFAFVIILIAMRKILSLEVLHQAFANAPLHLVMISQVFRVMGVGFLALFAMHALPGEFAISTGVGDILIGVTAPLVAYLYLLNKSFSKPVAKVWNYLGIIDLAVSIGLGLLTYPEPLRIISTEVSNLPIAQYPLVIIPIFAVPLSVLIHLFTLKAIK